MKVTRRQLRTLINEVMVGFPDDRAPFDATDALKSAKEKMKKEPALADMFDDDEDYDKKRQAYALGSMAVDLTDDEELAADMASDVITSPEDPDYHMLYDDDDYDKPEPEELDPDERFHHPKDSMPIEQPLQGIVSKIIPELQIAKHDRNHRVYETTTYYTPDKKYQILMSFRPEYVDEKEPQFSEPIQYTVEVRKYNPKYFKKYEQARFDYPGSMGSTFFDGTKAFWTSFYHTANFINVLKELKTYLKEVGAL